MSDVIDVRGVSRAYRRYSADRAWTWQELLVRGWPRAELFWALRDITFSIPAGRMVGVIGPNGAGKSTLLRLVGGVGRPDAGQIGVRGRLGSLLDLGAGFHAELTGRENALISGVISGLTKAEVAAQFDAMVQFAELEAFIDRPLRTYSGGMIMRLGFAVATHIEPEVLLIDEVLSVGDLAFQAKCLDRIRAFKDRGCTILLVSHDAEQVATLCDEALWLRAGRLVAHGAAGEVVMRYKAEMAARAHIGEPG